MINAVTIVIIVKQDQIGVILGETIYLLMEDMEIHKVMEIHGVQIMAVMEIHLKVNQNCGF